MYYIRSLWTALEFRRGKSWMLKKVFRCNLNKLKSMKWKYQLSISLTSDPSRHFALLLTAIIFLREQMADIFTTWNLLETISLYFLDKLLRILEHLASSFNAFTGATPFTSSSNSQYIKHVECWTSRSHGARLEPSIWWQIM